MNKFWQSLLSRRSFFTGSGILVSTTILSYVLGLIRDRLLSTTFGASRLLDSYNASFIVPDLILNIFFAGALSAAFIPLLSKYENNRDEHERNQFISSVFNSITLTILIFTLIAFVFASQISKIIVPGFDESEQSIYISLLRVILLSPIVFAISNTLGTLLITKDRFFWFGISAPIYNIGIIAGIILLVPHFGIFGVAYGALIGSILHLISRILGLRQHIIYNPVIKFNAVFKKFLKLMLPKMIGTPVEQLTLLGFTIIASYLGAGSIVILTFARNFQYAPVAILGINVAIAVFPSLTRKASAGQFDEYRHELWFTIKIILLTTVSAAIVIFVLRFWLTDLLLGGGEYGPTAITSTAIALGWFTLSIPTESLSQVLSRAFYALEDSKTPTVISIIGLIIAIGIGYLFSQSIGINGLIIGFFFGSLAKTLLLSLLLNRTLQSLLFARN